MSLLACVACCVQQVEYNNSNGANHLIIVSSYLKFLSFHSSNEYLYYVATTCKLSLHARKGLMDLR